MLFTFSRPPYLSLFPEYQFWSMTTQSTSPKTTILVLSTYSSFPFISQITKLSNSWKCFLSNISPVCPFLSILLALVYTIITSNRLLIGLLASSLSPLQVRLHIINIVLIMSIPFLGRLWSGPPSKPDLPAWSNGPELNLEKTESVAWQMNYGKLGVEERSRGEIITARLMNLNSILEGKKSKLLEDMYVRKMAR